MEIAAVLLLGYLIAKVIKLSMSIGVDKAMAKTLNKTTSSARKEAKKRQGPLKNRVKAIQPY